MTELEIIKAVRLLASDLRDFGASPITKASALELLTNASKDVGGGPLNRWCISLTDRRQKLLGRELLSLVVQAGYLHWGARMQEAVDRLPILCDQLEKMIQPEIIAMPPYPNPELLQRDQFIWENILAMSVKQLILEQEKQKNFGQPKAIGTEAGFRKAALRYSQHHKLPTRNFREETPYVATDTD